jgi:iron complex transport system permease protein
VTAASGAPGLRSSTAKPTIPRLALAVALLAAAVLVALRVGEPISLARAFAEPTSLDHAILFRARLPRVLLGVIAGAGLAVSGSAYQGLLRNPLAEPYVLGVAGGAALGATVALAIAGFATAASGLGLTAVVALAAAVSGALATALVYALASRGTALGASRAGSATAILLAGVVVNGIASAAITFVKTLVRASTAQQLLFWLAGFLDVPTTSTLIVLTVCVALGSAVLVMDAPRLNLLALGDEHATHLGVDVGALERRTFAATSLVVGAIVATCGMIGFVGLLVPHIVRRLLGADHRVLVPMSLVLGAATLVLCDLLARATFRWVGTEPPVGAITALVGGPVFLGLLWRGRV